MARGNFRIADRICLHCGYDAMSDDKKHLPYMYGKGANKVYICHRCANKCNGVEIKLNPHSDYELSLEHKNMIGLMSKLNEITSEMVEYVCDSLCKFPKEAVDNEELTSICSECKMGTYFNQINDYGFIECKK